ncbi:MAG TPA: serine/threonine-protein kinase, partial [Phycisphaerae bacterium]|nr:serine/threonine-protein kinase [Phycisphaerae bacterium]
MSLAQPIAWDSQNEPEPAPPDIESYGVIRLLARGGQGNLWLASRDADDQDCVIKTIFRFESGKAPTRERFLENCRLLASLDHPGLVGLIDYGVLPDSTLWQAMEYVAGRPLLDFIKAIDSKHTGNKARRSPTSAIARIVDLFIDVCDAVQAAHRVGIIHRDIKPSNILVDGAGRPRLLDFGIAKPISTEPGPAHTLTGHFVGSLAWSSPEQVECMPGNTDV